MALLLIQHRVADYGTWREAYDAVAEMQRTSGVTNASVHRMVDDPDNVLVLHDFASVEQARAFASLPELRDGMQRAGVQGEPRVELYE
jgi:hypothetical protein